MINTNLIRVCVILKVNWIYLLLFTNLEGVNVTCKYSCFFYKYDKLQRRLDAIIPIIYSWHSIISCHVPNNT